MTIENGFKVGEVIEDGGHGRILAYPTGTRFFQQSSGNIVIRANDGFIFTDQSSAFGTHVVVSIPKAPKPEPVPDPVGEIAKELWEQRNESVREVGLPGHLVHPFPSDEHEQIYRDLAELALRGDWDHLFPSAITDNDGDRWVHEGRGQYMFFGDLQSFSYVKDRFGIDSVEQ